LVSKAGWPDVRLNNLRSDYPAIRQSKQVNWTFDNNQRTFAGHEDYDESSLFRIRMVVQNRQSAIELFQNQNASHIVSERQRGKRPDAIRSLPDGIGNTFESADDESEPPGVFIHVL